MNSKSTLNEQITQILAEEDAKIERDSWKGKLKRIWKAESRKQAIKNELFIMLQNLSLKGMFTLFLVVAFVFMLTFSVL